MRLLAITAMLLFSTLAWTQKTIIERVTALETMVDNQRHYNEGEALRLALKDVQNQNAIALKLDDIKIEQAMQNRAVSNLADSINAFKTERNVLVGIVGFVSVWAMFMVSRKHNVEDAAEIVETKSDEDLLARLSVLEDFKKRTDLQMPLMTELAQTVRNGFIGVVHHPDDSHGAADDLLDLVGGPMTPTERQNLDSLMAERQQDKKVSQRERSLAESLPKVMNLIDKMIALQNNSDAVNATEIPYGETAPKLQKGAL
jgi:hypothetical protein